MRFTGTQDVRVALELQKALEQVVASGQPTIVNCSEVESLDASFLQLLLAVKRESRDLVRIEVDPESEAARWISYAGMTNQLIGASAVATTE